MKIEPSLLDINERSLGFQPESGGDNYLVIYYIAIALPQSQTSKENS